MSKLALLNEENLFETEIKEEQEARLPIALFQEIEAELCDHILHTAEGDETDGAIDFIKEIVENIKLEIELLFKIKTLLPEQKTVQIKKNGQVVRTVTVRRKTKNLQTDGQKPFKKNRF